MVPALRASRAWASSSTSCPTTWRCPTPETAQRGPVVGAAGTVPASPYARWFDVDWAAQERPILMPVLGRRIGAVRRRRRDHPRPPRCRAGPALFRPRLPGAPGHRGPAAAELLDAQHYRLAHWRVGDEELNYRRFFDIDTLAAIRVEDPQVFAETHAVLLALVARGQGRRAADRPPRRAGRPARLPAAAAPGHRRRLGRRGEDPRAATRRCPTTGRARARRATTRCAGSAGCSSTQPARRRSSRSTPR